MHVRRIAFVSYESFVGVSAILICLWCSCCSVLFFFVAVCCCWYFVAIFMLLGIALNLTWMRSSSVQRWDAWREARAMRASTPGKNVANYSIFDMHLNFPGNCHGIFVLCMHRRLPSGRTTTVKWMNKHTHTHTTQVQQFLCKIWHENYSNDIFLLNLYCYGWCFVHAGSYCCCNGWCFFFSPPSSMNKMMFFHLYGVHISYALVHFILSLCAFRMHGDCVLCQATWARCFKYRSEKAHFNSKTA